MKILYHILYTNTTGADRWVYEGWKDAWRELGHQFYEFKDGDSLVKKVNEIRPDIFWTAYNLINIASNKQKNLLKKSTKKELKFSLWLMVRLVIKKLRL